jgi:tripartite-type tricarboxylate transporter receptor subunit TctC
MKAALRRRVLLAGAAATPALASVGRSALAQDQYPSRPIRLVVPFPPGGSTDVIGRIVGNELQKRLGQSVVVENRPGASGSIGSSAVSRAAPDGYTLLFSNVASQGVMPALSPQAVTYDPVGDFTHIGMIGVYWAALLVHPSFPARTLEEFVAEAKRRPGEINFATSGIGSSPHLFVEMLKAAAGINIVHVPYRGAGPALTAVLANEVPVMADSLPSATPHIRSGALRALGVSSAQRVAAFPDLPTFAEQGYPKMAIDNWYGISAPPGLPAPIVGQVAEALNASLRDPAVADRLRQVGLEAKVMNGDEFRSFIAGMFDIWKETVRVSGVQLD